MSFKNVIKINRKLENKLFFMLHRLNYTKVIFPIHLYRLCPILITIINKNNDEIVRDTLLVCKLIENNIKSKDLNRPKNIHYIYQRKALFNIYNTYVENFKEIEKDVNTLCKLNLDEVNTLVDLSDLKIFNFFNTFLAIPKITLSKCLDVVKYVKYRYVYTFKHVFEQHTFVYGTKYVFNKLWNHNKDLPKFLVVPPSSVVVPGFSTISKNTIFPDGNVQRTTKVIHHKVDFDQFCLKAQNELIECQEFLFDLNSIKICNKLHVYYNIINKNIISIENSLSRHLSLVPLNIKQVLKLNKFNLDIFLIDGLEKNLLGLSKLYWSLIKIKDTLLSINLSKGYISSTDVFNKIHYPLIADVISLFIDEEKYNSLNNYFKTSCYKWVINIILLNFNSICCKALSVLRNIDKSKFLMDEELKFKELHSQFTILRFWSYNMLDNSIKQHLIKRNITVFSDIVCGFDTEYVPQDWGVNKMLSAQLSFAHITKLSIPIVKSFEFEGVNTLTSDTYIKVAPKFNDVDLLKSFIQSHIDSIRSSLFQGHDTMLIKLANYFINDINIKNICYSNKQSLINVCFDKSYIQNIFIRPWINETLKINFATIVNIAASKCRKRLDSEVWLLDLIKSIDFSLLDSKIKDFVPRFCESWDVNTLNSSGVVEMTLSNEMNKLISGTKIKVDASEVPWVQDIHPDAVPAKKQVVSWSYNDKFIKLRNLTVDGNFLEEISEKSPEEHSPQESSALEKSPEEMSSALEESSPLIKGELGGWENSPEEKLKIPLNFNRRFYLTSHYNTADLTLLEDWKDVSLKNIDIVKKCFTSLSLPVVCKDTKEKVFIRDTLLLASASARSLGALAFSYGLQKVSLETRYVEDMSLLLKENYELFKEYAMTDSLITLIHTLFINDFSFKLGSLTIPNTLGTLSSTYIKNKWKTDEYRGYQIDVNYPLGDARASHTPKGIQFGDTTLEMSNLYIGSYRGGRNECFRYGIDRSKTWFDYDLASCYSTIMSMMGQPEYTFNESEKMAAVAENIMSMMGHPDHSKACWINPGSDLSKFDFINSYSAVKIKFCLPKEIKYPPFPVTLDKSITVYPSSGITLVTGLEYKTGMDILNKNLDRLNLSPKDYYVEILYGSYIPFKKTYDKETKSEALAYSPFFDVIKELQANRRIWKKKTGKGSAMERMYKDLGNMLYGKIVCGISNKKVYDSRKLEMKTMIGNDLANPIIGTWITGFVRSLIAELLHEIDLLGGQVVSCTTDGFVCDIENLENKILESFDKKDSLLSKYRSIRSVLSGVPEALEVKTFVKGIVQWTTRGQLSLESLDEYGTCITAATGFQKSKDHKENVNLVEEAMINGNKILFLQKELTGALDTYLTKDHVSMKTSQRNFRTIYDSKRLVIESSKTMLETRPFNDTTEALLHRSLMMEVKQSIYSDEFSIFTIPPSKSAVDEVIKLFIRMISHMYHYNINTTLKFALASLIHEIDPKISEKYVINLFSAYESDKGNVVTKLPVFEKTKDFVLKLQKSLEDLKEERIYKEILLVFKTYFSNFLPVPAPNQKDILISKLTAIDSNKLVINSSIIDGKEIITIKIIE